VAARSSPVQKFNLIGRSGIGGGLESQFGRSVTLEDRALAVRAFDELKAADLIRPTYADNFDPENWVTITEAGRRALERGGLDNLDEALISITPHLVDVRRGAWAALGLPHPDSFRQAAHSGRELIDQVLKEGAPDAAVMSDPEFKGHDRESKVTRKDRLKFLMRRFQGEASESDIGIADQAIKLVLKIDNKLMALAHARSSPPRRDVEDCLYMAERTLRRVLVRPT
jgi:hypothetical protein